MAQDAQKQQPAGMSTATKVLIGLTGVGMLAFVGSVVAVVSMVNADDKAEVQESSLLMVDIEALPEAPVVGQFVLEPDDFPPLATELAAGIRAAADDDRITGMVLKLDGAAGGWASFQELRTAVDAFRAAGKPCMTYAESYGNGSYYLASGCDHIVMAPGGTTMVSGLAIPTT